MSSSQVSVVADSLVESPTSFTVESRASTATRLHPLSRARASSCRALLSSNGGSFSTLVWAQRPSFRDISHRTRSQLTQPVGRGSLALCRRLAGQSLVNILDELFDTVGASLCRAHLAFQQRLARQVRKLWILNRQRADSIGEACGLFRIVGKR